MPGPFSRSSYDGPIKSPNPNPRNFKIEITFNYGDYIAIWVKYPDCTNYEGRKILVYKGVSLPALLDLKCLDPHFSDFKPAISPIARFVPTDEGWKMAQLFIWAMYDEENRC